MSQSAVLTITDIAKAQLFAYNDKNWDKFRESITPSFTYTEYATGRTTNGAEDTLQVLRGWSASFPDSKATVRSEYVSNNTVILEITWRGTFKGPFNTPNGQIDPNGKTLDLPACQVIEVSGDKVSSVRHYFDVATLLKQIGAMPK